MDWNYLRNVIGLVAFSVFLTLPPVTPAWAVPFISITDLTEGSPSLSVSGVDIISGTLVSAAETLSFSGILHIPSGFGTIADGPHSFVLTEPGDGISDILTVTATCATLCRAGIGDFLEGITVSFTSLDGLVAPLSAACTTLENGNIQSCALFSTNDHELLDLFVQSDVAEVPVPEPSSLALLAAGLVGLAAVRRRYGA